MYKLTVSGLAAGQELLIDGIGRVKNGTFAIDNEQAEMFRRLHPVRDEETNKGPTLLQAFENHPHISVEKIDAKEFNKIRNVPEEEPPVVSNDEGTPAAQGGDK